MDNGRFPNTLLKQKTHLKKMNQSKTDLQLAIVHKPTMKVIGTIGIHEIDRVNGNADVSLVIGDKNFRGKGFAKEAIQLIIRHVSDWPSMHKLTAGMFEENIGSYKAFRFAGFRQEGLLRHQCFKDGIYRNIIKMGLILK